MESRLLNDIELVFTGWHGTAVQSATGCGKGDALGFRSTAEQPDGSYSDIRAFQFQVIDFRGIVPFEHQSRIRAVRMKADFHVFDDTDDRQFGIRLDAFAGNIDAFPVSLSRHTSIPDTTAEYTLVDRRETTYVHSGQSEWSSIELLRQSLPETDFYVAYVEAYEDELNDQSRFEFNNQNYADNVQVLFLTSQDPTAYPDVIRTTQGNTGGVNVLSNDSDPDSDWSNATVTIAGEPSSGSVQVISAGLVMYTPATDFVGRDRFSYIVTDYDGNESNEASVSVIVSDQPPTAIDDAYTFTGVEANRSASTGLLQNDINPGPNPLQAHLVGQPRSGVLDLQPDGSFSYFAGSRFPGEDVFTYYVDNGTARSDEATVTLNGTARAEGSDLQLSHFADATGPIFPDAQASVWFTVSNNGPSRIPVADAAVRIVSTDFEILPREVPLASGSFDAATGIWSVGSLPYGDYQTVQLRVRPYYRPGTRRISATIIDGLAGDTNAANNTDLVLLDVRPAVYDVYVDDISFFVGGVSAGQTFTTRVTIKNSGPHPVQRIKVTLPVPRGLAYESHVFGFSFGAYDPTTGIVEFASELPSLGQVRFDLVTTPTALGDYAFRANVFYAPADTDVSNNVLEATYTAQ
jgi:uncharacterized repeat protein (TIGR01451 family)